MSLRLLDGLTEDDRERILQIARRRTFRRQEVVFHRGDPAESCHIIVRGRFGVRVGTRFGDTVMLAVMGADEAFGELALIRDGGERTATVIALEDGETRSLHRQDFAALRAQHPSVTDVLVRALADNVQRLNDLLVDATWASAETRVLHRIAELVQGRAPADVPLTQEQIAELAGTSRATVNRVLREAADRGHVALRRGEVTVLDLEGLEDRARRR